MESGDTAKNNYQPHREGIREGVDFGLELRFKPRTHSNDVNALIEALRAWSLFGGLGSRARRGFGSVTLTTLNGQDVRLDRAGYESAVQAILDTASLVQSFPPFTAFSHQSRFGILNTGTEAQKVHNQAGLLYKNHRGQPSSLRGEVKIPFGLPLQGVDLDNRRASPLLFHIHALKDGSFVAAILYLPAEFHHDRRYQPADLETFYREVARFVPAEAHP